MQTEYLTEIYRKPVKNNKHAYSSQDFEQIQKNSMLGQLYQQVDKYYTDKIDSGEYSMAFGYCEIDGVEYAHAGIYDNATGEQVL